MKSDSFSGWAKKSGFLTIIKNIRVHDHRSSSILCLYIFPSSSVEMSCLWSLRFNDREYTTVHASSIHQVPFVEIPLDFTYLFDFCFFVSPLYRALDGFRRVPPRQDMFIAGISSIGKNSACWAVSFFSFQAQARKKMSWPHHESCGEGVREIWKSGQNSPLLSY